MNAETSRETIFLIINADDYGRTDGISRGILKAIECGIVSATGVLSNSPFFEKHIKWLESVGDVDFGVHLNLTLGNPLTTGMASALKFLHNGNGSFCQNKYKAALDVLLRKLPLELIEKEWDAQINRCTSAGLSLQFINSHEHIHALPSLFRLVQKLAARYNIPFLRNPTAEWLKPLSTGGVIRNAVLQALEWFNGFKGKKMSPTLLGVSCSGKLSKDYLSRRFLTLQHGQVYELMCHPGYYQAEEIVDPHLLTFHDWEGELNALCDPSMHTLLQSNNIKLIRFQDLTGC